MTSPKTMQLLEKRSAFTAAEEKQMEIDAATCHLSELIGVKIIYRPPFDQEAKKATIVGLTRTLDDQDVLVLDNGDYVIKGSQIICPLSQQPSRPAC